MMSSMAHSSPRRAALTYTLRGMMISSALYPLLTVGMLAVATLWTGRPSWRAPHIRHTSRH